MKTIVVAVLAGVLACPAAFADGRHRGRGQPPDRHVEYARVVDVQPIYRSVEVRVPRDECWDERVVYQDRDRHADGNRTAGLLIGAAAGGAAGHQFGNGRGRDAATIIGALIGATIGQDAAARQGPPAVREEVAYEQRCRTVSDREIEQHVQGYDVTYRYQGRTYHTRMPYDPGDSIPVNVDVRPAPY